jgi:hypothetical protein
MKQQLKFIVLFFMFIAFYSCVSNFEYKGSYVKNQVKNLKTNLLFVTLNNYKCTIVKDENYDIYFLSKDDTLDHNDIVREPIAINKKHLFSFSPINLEQKFKVGMKVNVNAKVYISKERLENTTSSYNVGLPTVITSIEEINQ